MQAKSQRVWRSCKSSFENFKKAVDKLRDHFGSKGKRSHQDATEIAMRFSAMMKKRTLAIDYQLISQCEELAERNRQKPRLIAATILLCGRQGIALKGHHDDGVDDQDAISAMNGNFQALLCFRIDGDEVLKHHLETTGRNALYTSKEAQNEMIASCGDIARRKVIQRIHEAGFYSIIADEATDSANQEQLSISVWYLEKGTPTERFLCFRKCQEGVCGEAIANAILERLTAWQLNP